MALDKVANEILENAQQEANLRIQRAEEERARIMKDADSEIEKIQRQEEKDLQEAILRMRRQELSSAELEAKKVVLNKRKEVLNRTFEETLQDLSAMGPKEKSALYKKILAEGKKVISRPKVYCPTGEADLLAGLRGAASLTEIDMEPGLLIESEDGTVRLDLRFRTILESIWDKELKNVSNILFE
ncbi:V-type ATP synthase subunit E family protein [Methanomassiliicoccus luminyensis]|uniref:V-type ATP synthase subunit E family protein n=1 Tax=Methanomassiliicoccus luminyensis TaxID=1080712 RepID=UPI000474D455|nr:V-type ATP synthase subunit E family protein [Methanomassiliicoccus luminyensis]